MKNNVQIIDINTLWKCETCFHDRPGGCSTYCDYGESYRPAASKLKIIDPNTMRNTGHWIYEAHEEKSNYRWNVTAECSECGYDCGEIWAGFFPNVQYSLAKDVSLLDAKRVKLSNFCPECGAMMLKK